jgi:hypothetical protein
MSMVGYRSANRSCFAGSAGIRHALLKIHHKNTKSIERSHAALARLDQDFGELCVFEVRFSVYQPARVRQLAAVAQHARTRPPSRVAAFFFMPMRRVHP